MSNWKGHPYEDENAIIPEEPITTFDQAEARAEAAERERDEAWNAAIEAAAKHLEQEADEELYERGLIKWYAKASSEIRALKRNQTND